MAGIVVNGVTGKPRWESFRKGRTDNGPFVVIEYLIDDYTQADAFADGVMGGVVSSGGSGGSVSFVPRQRCPTNSTLYALRAEIGYEGPQVPGGTGGLPQFSTAIVSVEYGLLAWPQFASDDPGGLQSFPNDGTPGQPYVYAECEIDYGGQMISLPSGSYSFVGPPILKADAPVTKWEALTTWRVTRHNYPSLPAAAVAQLVNKINNATFLGQSAGHVRFAGGRTQLQMTSDGTRVQRFEMTFEVRTESTWNQFIRPDNGEYDTIQRFVALTPPYVSADLSPLLR